MADFDAELYLRLVGEMMVLGMDPDRHHGATPLDEAAGALIAIGAITRARAQTVIGEYGLAQALRSEHGRYVLGMRQTRRSSRTSKPLKLGRVVPVQRTIETESGTMIIRSVRFERDQVSVSILFTANGRKRTRRRSRGPMLQHMPWGASTPRLTDDKGTSTELHFSGGWGDSEADGELSGDQLSPTTRWLELDGARFSLDAEPVHADVTVEPLLDNSSAAIRYLWRRISISEHGPGPSIGPAVNALIAAGSLAPDDPVITTVESVQEQLPHHPGMMGQASKVRGIPEAWRSMFRRAAAEDGPTGSIALNAVTPQIDGHHVGLLGIESDPSGFQAKVQVSPADIGSRMRSGGMPGDQLAWWCRDDKNNYYLGGWGNWSSADEDHASGEISFWPALDPKAERLEVLPTGPAERAVIAFRLSWTQPAEETKL